METCPRCGDRPPERSRFCPACGTPVSAAPAARERRKVVTVIFADVVGSTALGERVDPETLRWAMQRWFERMGNAIERHGGTVENFIGDAVMGVFGIPVVHEDDALRAVRAAAEMREEVAALRGELRRERGVELAIRIGVNTGEAVTGATAAGGFFTAGDIVNVAARLEQAARPGDILLGHDTFSLVRHAVDAEPVAPLMVKGKRAPLEAHRLLAVATDARGRPQRPWAPMVGRQRERRRLLDTFHQAVADRSCQLFTVLGAAGVGKSRLVAEGLETIDGAATVLVGRCLPYGDGLTWWPLVEALGGPGLLGRAGPEAGDAVARVSDLLEPTGAPVALEEACWAVRKVLEALGRQRPVILVVDDLQWAEPTFVELVEYIADWARDAPLLLLIMARPELLDTRPGWGGGKANATSVLLEPLAEAEAADLLRYLLGPALLGDRAAARIVEVAEGNPLYVEEIVAMLADQGGLDAPDRDVPIAVPPTIQALLAARLDGLADGERAVIEAAAIEGKEFARERVEALVGDSMREPVRGHLSALVRLDLIRPAGAQDGAFRFRHQLIRDAAYDGIPKETRAALHERFADWLEDRRPSLPSVDELLGHHLERAVLLRRELGAGEAATSGLAARASSSLLRAGRRAAAREEVAAAVRMLERAAALAPGAERPMVLVHLADALQTEGELLRAAATARDAGHLARAASDRRSATRARLIELRIVIEHTDSDSDMAAHETAVRPLIAELERLGDDEGLAAGLRLMAWIARDRYEEATAYLQRALVHAERAGNRLDAVQAVEMLGLLAVFGPVPVPEAMARCHALRERVAGHRGTTAFLLAGEAVLLAMRGDIDQARALHADADAIIEDLAVPSLSAYAAFPRTILELLAGAPARAERAARAGFRAFEAMHNRGQGSTAAALLGLTLVEQGRDDEALEYADLAAAWAMRDDLDSQTSALAVRARVLARRGELEAAETAARDEVALSQASDNLKLRGDALVNLALVLKHAGRADEAADALSAALTLYERKGNIASASRARALIESELRPAGVTDT